MKDTISQKQNQKLLNRSCSHVKDSSSCLAVGREKVL